MPRVAAARTVYDAGGRGIGKNAGNSRWAGVDAEIRESVGSEWS